MPRLSPTDWNPSPEQIQRFGDAFQGELKSLHVEYHKRYLTSSGKVLRDDDLVKDWSKRIWVVLEQEVLKEYPKQNNMASYLTRLYSQGVPRSLTRKLSVQQILNRSVQHRTARTLAKSEVGPCLAEPMSVRDLCDKLQIEFDRLINLPVESNYSASSVNHVAQDHVESRFEVERQRPSSRSVVGNSSRSSHDFGSTASPNDRCDSVDAQEKNHEFLNLEFSLLAQRLSSYLGHSSKGYTPTPVVPPSMEKRYYPLVPHKDSFCPLPIAPSSVDGYALSPFSGDIPLESPGAGSSSGWSNSSVVASRNIGNEAASWQDKDGVKLTNRESADIPDLAAYRRGMRTYALKCRSLLEDKARYNSYTSSYPMTEEVRSGSEIRRTPYPPSTSGHSDAPSSMSVASTTSAKHGRNDNDEQTSDGRHGKRRC